MKQKSENLRKYKAFGNMGKEMTEETEMQIIMWKKFG